jgi:hypothetical protein
MPNSADALRRWLGLLFLALAFGLLIWGHTVLEKKLENDIVLFTFYWGACFVFVFAAILTALLDIRATRKRARQEQDELLHRTMGEVDRDSHDHESNGHDAPK